MKKKAEMKYPKYLRKERLKEYLFELWGAKNKLPSFYIHIHREHHLTVNENCQIRHYALVLFKKEDLSMAVSNMKAAFKHDIDNVWRTVTSFEDYAWRSDLSKVEILNEKQFIEYTKEGYATTFTITVTEPFKRWEFDMENDNIKGHWIGIFTQQGEETEIDFTEDVTAKKSFMRPFIKAYLKRQQTRYISDLKRALREQS